MGCVAMSELPKDVVTPRKQTPLPRDRGRVEASRTHTSDGFDRHPAGRVHVALVSTKAQLAKAIPPKRVEDSRFRHNH